MSLLTLMKPIEWGWVFQGGDTYTSPSAETMNGAAVEVNVALRLAQAGTIRQVHFRLGSVSVGDDLRISLEEVDGNANPTGEQQYRVVPIVTGDANTWKASGILSHDGTDGGTKREVAVGDLMAVRFRFDDYGSGNLQIAAAYSPSQTRLQWPIVKQSTNSGAAWNFRGRNPLIAVEYDDGSFKYLYACMPMIRSTVTLTTGTSPNDYSWRFQLPFAARVIGGEWLSGQREMEYFLTTDANTPITDPAITQGASTASNALHGGFFPEPATLQAGTWYRLRMQPTGTSGIFFPLFTLGHADWKPAVGFTADNYMVGHRTGSGSWTDAPDLIVPARLLIDGIAGGEGGGPSGGGLPNGTAVIPPFH